MRKKHRKVWRVLNYIDHLLILISTGTGSASSATGLKICVLTAGIKYKSKIKKKKKEHDKIVFLAKSKLNRIEVLISKALIDSLISHDEIAIINNVLKEFYGMKEEIKNSNDK